MVFQLHIWIQHPEKPLGAFDCAETSYETWDSIELLPDFDRKNPPERLSKSRIIDNCFFLSKANIFLKYLNRQLNWIFYITILMNYIIILCLTSLLPLKNYS